MDIDLSKLAKSALFGAIFFATCLSASAASFDCAKARSTSERLICSDPQLSALDDRLAALAAAGKKRAANRRAYQRALDAAWSVRQKCEDIACVQSWYAQRIAALSNAQMVPDTYAEHTPPEGPPVAPPIPARPEVAAKAQAPALPAAEKRAPLPSFKTSPVPSRTAVAPAGKPSAAPNVTPGAQLQVIGEELGFHIPLTREEFLDRYLASGGQCGTSQHLPALKALSRSVESDCWTGSKCPAPAAGLNCKILRTAYDSNARIVLFTTTLSTATSKRAEGVSDMGKLAEKIALFGGSETRTSDTGNGPVLSASGSQGKFKVEVEVAPAEEGGQVGTFTVVTE
ncbi:MAG: hypothetical protein V4857_28655 [Pseudomonadota bacterium]